MLVGIGGTLPEGRQDFKSSNTGRNCPKQLLLEVGKLAKYI